MIKNSSLKLSNSKINNHSQEALKSKPQWMSKKKEKSKNKPSSSLKKNLVSPRIKEKNFSKKKDEEFQIQMDRIKKVKSVSWEHKFGTERQF